jgi:ankyrin repeat protein
VKSRRRLVVAVALLVGGCGWIGIDRRDEHGMTALMYAARAGNVAEAERLIGRGARVNAEVPTRDVRELIAFISWMQELPKSDIGYTPLLYAVQGGHHAMTALVLRHGADVNHAARFGMTAVSLATDRSDVALLTMLAAAGAKARPGDLMLAVNISTPQTVRFLLSLGVSPHGPMPLPSKNYEGPRPPLLMLAIDRGEPEIVRALIEAGVDVTERDENGWTALRRARHSRGSAIIELLQQAGLHDDGAADDAVLDAARNKDPAAVVDALGKRADPQAKDRSGVTALVIAARNGDAATVDTLLRAGAEVNASTPHAGTPLMAAARNGHVEVIERLLAAGADVRARDRIIQTALYAAVQRRHEGAVRALLAAKADPNDGSLPAAALSGNVAVVSLLLDHGADLGRYGGHALYEAARAGKDEVVLLLLERGADARGGPGAESTPLHRAASSCGPEVVRALLARGADPNARGPNDYTPLLHAASAGKIENVRLLIGARADVNAVDSAGKKILHYAERYPDVEEELRRAGAR